MLLFLPLCALCVSGCTLSAGPSGGDARPDAATPDAMGDLPPDIEASTDTVDAGGSADAGSPQGDAASVTAPGAPWSMGYYYAPQQAKYPVAAIDWPALTQLAVAFYAPQADGSLDETLGLDTTAGPALAAELVAAAHAHGVKAIASIGGAQSGASFQTATAPATLPTFVSSLTALLTKYGYDGIDIDWEPLTPPDVSSAVAIATQVRAGHPGVLLTIPVTYTNGNHPSDLSGLSAVAAAYDQIDIMTYHMAGPWSGWKSWHTSALYYSDSATPSSIDESVTEYLAAGVPASKLGFGLAFYGICYTPPVTGPDQALGSTSIVDTSMTYTDIVANYASTTARQWDGQAHVPYLSFAAPTGPNGCTFVTYDDPQSIAEKGNYLRAKSLGGIIVWTINDGAVGSQSPLLEAVRTGILGLP